VEGGGNGGFLGSINLDLNIYSHLLILLFFHIIYLFIELFIYLLFIYKMHLVDCVRNNTCVSALLQDYRLDCVVNSVVSFCLVKVK